MDQAWFETDLKKAQTWQSWWIHIGTGGNIRRAGTPIRLTKRMAHVFPRAAERTIPQNLRWAQVVGMGGNDLPVRSYEHVLAGTSKRMSSGPVSYCSSSTILCWTRRG
jgi:hypothetical protein